MPGPECFLDQRKKLDVGIFCLVQWLELPGSWRNRPDLGDFVVASALPPWPAAKHQVHDLVAPGVAAVNPEEADAHDVGGYGWDPTNRFEIIDFYQHSYRRFFRRGVEREAFLGRLSA